jgi:anti-sigma B factor antagonist
MVSLHVSTGGSLVNKSKIQYNENKFIPAASRTNLSPAGESHMSGEETMKQPEKIQLRTETTDTQYTVYVSGELDLEVASQMRAAMAPLVESTDRSLVLNLRDLQYIDSTGIGILVSVLKARHARQMPFYVEAIPPGILKLFDMTGITPYITKQDQA